MKHKTLLMRHLLNIEMCYILIHEPWPPQPPKVTGNFKSYFKKYLV